MKPLQFYSKAFWQFPVMMTVMIVMEIGQAFSLVLMPYAVRDIVQAAETFDRNIHDSLWDVLHTPFMFLVWVTVAMVICSRVSGTLLIFTAQKIRRRPRLWLFDHLLNHSVEYFSSRHSGALGAKIHDVTGGIAMATSTVLFDFLSLFILFVASVLTIGVVYVPIGVLVAIWGIVYLISLTLITIPRIYWIERISKARARITGRVIDAAANILSVKAFARIPHERKLLRDAMEEEEYSNIRFGWWREIAGWVHFILQFALIVGGIYYCIAEYDKDLIDLATISYIFTLLFVLTSNARNLMWSMQAFMEYVGQIRDGIHTIMVPHDIRNKSGEDTLQIKNASIQYDNVRFSYEGLKQKVVINDFNLHVAAGQKIGLIGPSGAGKSTLVNLLLRFYDVNEGRILIDGQDINSVTQESLRSSIAMIPQDTALFHRSLMDNIRYGRIDAHDDDVVEAARRAHADEFIQALPEKYNTMVGERGVKLSGGQRQRIAIARAILKDAPILILDEATSALDSESERLIQDSLATLMEGKTVIAIAHRLSTIAHLDHLVVMDQGKIVEQGNHDTLLKLDGLYAKLWRMQSGGFLIEDDS